MPQSKVLIAVTTCYARRDQARAQRSTWALGQSCVRFFVGRGGEATAEEIALDCDDSYEGLPEKVRAVMRYAHEHDYDAVLKCDDDVFVCVDRFLKTYDHLYKDYDYVGNFRTRTGGHPHDYASGFAYVLSRRAIELVAMTQLTSDVNEDRWVGQIMGGARVRTLDEKRFACPHPQGIEDPRLLWTSPLGKSGIAFAQYPAAKFSALDVWYRRIIVREGFGEHQNAFA